MVKGEAGREMSDFLFISMLQSTAMTEFQYNYLTIKKANECSRIHRAKINIMSGTS